MFFPERVAAADAWVGQGGDCPRDVELPDQGDVTLHVWCWEAGHGCLWAMAHEAALQAAMQAHLRETEWRTKPLDAQRAAEGEAPMARASLAVELRAHPIASPTLAGEAGLLAARRDEEARQVAARPVWRMAAQMLRV
jgi:hypothetical protein